MQKKVKTVKKIKGKSLSELKKEFDSVFSEYIRRRDKGICFTCGKELYWKYQQNGHYVPRQHMNTRFDEDNCHCQCVACNIFKKGNMDVYALNLIKLYGPNILTDLNKKKNTIRKWSTVEMQEAIDFYKAKNIEQFRNQEV